MEDYKALSPAFEPDVYELFNVERSINARTNPGAPSKANVKAQLERWKAALE